MRADQGRFPAISIWPPPEGHTRCIPTGCHQGVRNSLHVIEPMRYMDLLTGTRGAVDKETDVVTLLMELIRDLALRRPGTPVLSVYVRTDPRDPANTAAVPGWLVELRNSLREVSREVEDRESRERRMAVRDLRERVEHDSSRAGTRRTRPGPGLVPHRRRLFDHRVTLQLPPLATLARWDDRRYVSPLAEVAGAAARPDWCWSVRRRSGCCTGRTAGSPSGRSLYEIEPGQWRDYDAYVGYPGRSPAGLHVAEFDQRVREWRQRFSKHEMAEDQQQRRSIAEALAPLPDSLVELGDVQASG